MLTGIVKDFRVFTLLYKYLARCFHAPLLPDRQWSDPVTCELLRSTLEPAGIETVIAEDGAGMWKQMAKRPDVVILDLSLPDTDGIELLRQLRRISNMPVLIHSTRSDDIERILGIEIGADNFLPKPCNLRELLARVRALLRRSHAQPGAARSSPNRWFLFDGWKLNCGTRTLVNPAGQQVGLNTAAFSILSLFLEQPQVPLSREQLARAPCGENICRSTVRSMCMSASCEDCSGHLQTEASSSRRYALRGICSRYRWRAAKRSDSPRRHGKVASDAPQSQQELNRCPIDWLRSRLTLALGEGVNERHPAAGTAAFKKSAAGPQNGRF